MSVLSKAFLTTVGLVVALIPIGLFFVARWIFQPIDFWQNLALFTIWLVLCGWLQVWLVVLLIAWILSVWDK